MRTVTPKRLWVDVPPSERVDREFLETRHGAHCPNGAEWVAKLLAIAMRDDGCGAAIKWYSVPGRFNRCSYRVAPGEQFCPLHGGAKLPPPVKTPADPQIEIDRRQRQRETLTRKRDEIDAKLVALDNHGYGREDGTICPPGHEGVPGPPGRP